MGFDFFADSAHLTELWYEMSDYVSVLTQKSQQEMLSFYVMAAVLASFVAREKDSPSRLFRESLKHKGNNTTGGETRREAASA